MQHCVTVFDMMTVLENCNGILTTCFFKPHENILSIQNRRAVGEVGSCSSLVGSEDLH